MVKKTSASIARYVSLLPIERFHSRSICGKFIGTKESVYIRKEQTRTQSLFMCFGGERRLGVRLRRAWGLMGRDEVKIDPALTPRAPQRNPQSSLTPKNTYIATGYESEKRAQLPQELLGTPT